MLTIENVTIERHPLGFEIVAAISFNGCSDKIICEWWDGEATEWQLLVTLPSCVRVSPYSGTASVLSALN